jgi:phosphotransferase system enzyme I (PtsI)
MLVEGFENTPPYNCLYNYPYYVEYMERMGFVKETDWIQFRLNGSQGAPEKLKRMADILMKRYNLRLLNLKEIKGDLKKEGIPFDNEIEVGCMVETASASLIADLIAKEADFFSIGTNDLTQYTMAVDRGNADVEYLYSAFQPAVLRSIRQIIVAAKEAGIPVGMCGEAAADPLMIPLLMSFGLDEYSVNPVLVLTSRCIISKWSKAEADALAAKVMAMDNVEDIVAALKAAAKE